MPAPVRHKTILHVIDSTEPGGAETVFVQLADEFRKRGYRCITVVSGPGWVTDELRRRNFEPVIINAKGAFNLSLVRGLVRLVKQEKVDLIQSHLLGSNVYCALVGLLTRTPVVATFHGMVDVSPDERLRWLKYQIMNLGVSRFVAVSKKLRDAIFAEGLLDLRRTEIVYNGIEFDRYAKTSVTGLKELLGLAPAATLIGSLGNLHPAKGYPDLISAARIVVDARPDVHFVVAGHTKPDLLSDLQQRVSAAGLDHHVHFIGFVTDSARFLAQLDVFLLTSISEGFSIATVEAMATGLPIVSTRCGGPEEIISDGSNGLLVDVGDTDAVARAIHAILSDGETASRLGLNARSTAIERYGVDAMLGRYERIYAQLGPDSGREYSEEAMK